MRTILIFIIAIITLLSSNAQTVQKGIVTEYNEKAKKTPLAGVELNVRSAGNTVSDKEGAFTLNFLTLKPGEKINVRRIEKLGYELFNKEAIDQWNLNPTTPFLIIMCRTDRFKKIRDNYEKVSSESYARQLKKEESALAKLKADGRLKEEEYQQNLYELRENYEKQLDNLDGYIDRFSRIDLSELSTIEQEIIELVQVGEIDRAIAKYEEQDYIGKYTTEIEEVRKITNAIVELSTVREHKINSIDSLLSAINRQIETLKIAGGRENFKKIKTIVTTLANSDSNNYELQIKAGLYLQEQNDDDALVFLKRCEKSDSALLKAQALLCMSSIYLKKNDPEMAYALASNCLDILSKHNNLQADLLVMSQISIINSIQASFEDNHYFTLNEKILSRINNIEGDDYFCNVVKAQAYSAIAYSIYKNKDIPFDERMSYINEALKYADLSHNQAETSNNKNITKDLLTNIEAQKITLLFDNEKEILDEDIIQIYETSKAKYNNNPTKYERLYQLVSQLYLKYLAKKDEILFLSKVIIIFQDYKEQGAKDALILYSIDDLISYINKIGKPILSIKLFDILKGNLNYNVNDGESANIYAYLLYKIYASYFNIGDECNYIDLLKECVSLYSKIEAKNMLDTYSKNVYYPQVLSNLGSYYSSIQQYDLAIPLFCKAIEYNKMANNDLSISNLLYNLWECSICYLQIGNLTTSNQYLNQIIQFEEAVNENESITEILALAYNNLSWTEYENKNYNQALILINKAINYNPKYVPILDNKGLYLFALGNLDEAKSIMKLIESISDTETSHNTDLFKVLNNQ